jgi:cytochrome P450
MRRTAFRDAEVGAKRVRAGEKIALWYSSGNRDDTAIQDADRFAVDREKPDQQPA